MATDYKIAVVPDTGMHPVPSVSGTTTTTADCNKVHSANSCPNTVVI